jgi:hypothetical protein
MEPAEITFFTVLALGIVWNMVRSHNESERPKKLWVIEDSDDDYTFLKMFCEFSNTVMERHKSADHLFWKFLLKKPDCVIVDYYLAGEITGDKVIELCKLFKIPCRLITGNTQEIEGVPEEKIIRKSTGSEWCHEVQIWFDAKVA